MIFVTRYSFYITLLDHDNKIFQELQAPKRMVLNLLVKHDFEINLF